MIASENRYPLFEIMLLGRTTGAEPLSSSWLAAQLERIVA